MDDRTVLHEVCNRGQLEMLRILLLDEQINLEALDKRGNTPLHIAAKKVCNLIFTVTFGLIFRFVVH